jgi:hypothetical protein
MIGNLASIQRLNVSILGFLDLTFVFEEAAEAHRGVESNANLSRGSCGYSHSDEDAREPKCAIPPSDARPSDQAGLGAEGARGERRSSPTTTSVSGTSWPLAQRTAT